MARKLSTTLLGSAVPLCDERYNIEQQSTVMLGTAVPLSTER
jgi:hypothetical protein